MFSWYDHGKSILESPSKKHFSGLPVDDRNYDHGNFTWTYNALAGFIFVPIPSFLLGIIPGDVANITR